MKIIGHRGARGLAPENTIAGLKKGLEHKVDEVEFDLRVTKDGVVVLHHDRDLVDPNGKRLSIAGHTYRELQAHKPDLPTLSQALDALKNTVPLYIEVKPGEPAAPIITALQTAFRCYRLFMPPCQTLSLSSMNVGQAYEEPSEPVSLAPNGSVFIIYGYGQVLLKPPAAAAISCPPIP